MLVAKAILWAPVLSDRAWRVLVPMALTALDRENKQVPANLYFGGQQALTRALRQQSGTNDSAVRTVKRAIEELVKKGAVRLSQSAIANANAVYELTLDNALPIEDDQPTAHAPHWTRGDTQSPPGRDTQSPPGGDTQRRAGGHPKSPPIRNQEEPLEELKEEYGVQPRGPVTVRARDEDEMSYDSKCGNAKCVMGYIPNPDRDKPRAQRNIRCPTCHPPNVIPFGKRKGA